MIKNQDENNDVILDFASLFQTLWKDKFLIMFFVILSIPASIYLINSSSVIYRAEAILEISKSSSPSVTSSPSNNNLLSIPFLENMGAKSTSSFVPFITGQEFLQKLIERNNKLTKTLDRICGFKPTQKGHYENYLFLQVFQAISFQLINRRK